MRAPKTPANATVLCRLTRQSDNSRQMMPNLPADFTPARSSGPAGTTGHSTVVCALDLGLRSRYSAALAFTPAGDRLFGFSTASPGGRGTHLSGTRRRVSSRFSASRSPSGGATCASGATASPRRARRLAGRPGEGHGCRDRADLARRCSGSSRSRGRSPRLAGGRRPGRGAARDRARLRCSRAPRAALQSLHAAGRPGPGRRPPITVRERRCSGRATCWSPTQAAARRRRTPTCRDRSYPARRPLRHAAARQRPRGDPARYRPRARAQARAPRGEGNCARSPRRASFVLVALGLLSCARGAEAVGVSGRDDPRIAPFALLVAPVLELLRPPVRSDALSPLGASCRSRIARADRRSRPRSRRAPDPRPLEPLRPGPAAAVYLALFSHPTPPERLAAARQWAAGLTRADA